MNDRIRIDAADVARAPEAPLMPSTAPRAVGSPEGGEVFGSVAGIAAGPGAQSKGAFLRSPKFLFPVAGLVAALVSSLLTDGLAGFGRYERNLEEPPLWVSFLFMTSFSSLLTMAIAAADDVASGAFGRAALFGAIGFVGGLISGVIALFAGGIVMMLVGSLVASGLETEPQGGKLLLMITLMRAPAWCVVGLFCGVVVGALGRSWRRVLLGALGGAVGGLAGGLTFDPIGYIESGGTLEGAATLSRLVGLALTGIGTGFAIAFAENAAKQVWLAIERGRLVGKQFILYRNPTMIGASYGNDVFLFKDPTVQQQHARILKRGGGYTVEALPGALLRVNGQPVVSRTIQSGDTLQVGETLMRFHARQ
ncbi:MAG: hypothetical protein RLY21_2275 [Planctomycetota bacterium]|jgi:hypothetical protein